MRSLLHDRRFQSGATATLLLLALANDSRAVDLPPLRQGKWELQRTFESANMTKPLAMTENKCVDPAQELKRENEFLAKAGCTFTPMTKSGNSYTFVTSCTLQGKALRSETTITVDSDGAYTVKVASTDSGSPVVHHETTAARRTGNCKPST